MINEDERKRMERAATKIVAMINAEDFTAALIQIQIVAKDLVYIRNQEIKNSRGISQVPEQEGLKL